MKVVLVAHWIYPDLVGGTELFTFKLARQLAKENIAVHLVTSAGKGSKMLAQDGIKVHDVGFPGYTSVCRLKPIGLLFFNALVLLKCRQLRNSDATSSVVFCMGTHGSPASYLLSRLLGGRLMIRGCGSDVNSYFSDNRTIRRIFDLTFLKVCALADVMVVSNREMIERLRSVGIKRIERISNGFDERSITEAAGSQLFRDMIRSELRLTGESKMLLQVGGVKRVKGIATLHEAFKILRRDLDDLRLVVVGTGNAASFRQITEEEPDKCEILVGRVPYERVVDYLSVCDVFVLPSYSEAMPTALLEALAMKRPVVASRIAGHMEIIRDGEDGLLVSTRDPGALALAIRRFLVDREFAARCGRSGHERVCSVFTQRATFNKYLEVLQALENQITKRWQAAKSASSQS